MKRLLIVEDDVFLGNALSAKLTKEGFEIDLIGDGTEVMPMLKKNSYDVVLLDLVMPKMDGFAVLEQINKDGNFSKIPVLVLSNLGQDEDLDKAKGLGARDYIIKDESSISDIVTEVNKLV